MNIAVENILTLNNVRADFTMHSGRIYVILGSNGCGKTTLLKTVIGLLPLRDGHVLADGRDFFKLSRREVSRIFAFVPQFFNVSLPLPVLEVVSMGAVNSVNPFVSVKSQYTDALNILDECSIGHLADRMITQLSGGELAMVNLARAVMQNSEFIMLDEVDASLDLKRKRDYYNFIKKMAVEKGKGVAVITHSPDFLFSIRGDDEVLAVSHDGRFHHEKVRNVTEEFLSGIYGVPLKFISSDSGKGLTLGENI